MKLITIGAITLLTSMSFASTVWYNGDDDSLGGWAALSGTPNGQNNLEAMQFEDFTWSSALNAGTVMGTMLGTSSFSQVKWEIRQGMDVNTQNVGTLIASGTIAPTLVSLGAWALSNTFTVYAMTGNISSVALTNGGTYYLGMAIVVPGSTFTGGFVESAGVNGVGTPQQNHNSFAMSPSGALTENNPGFGNTVDLSMGIGTAIVPEPASLAALSLGAVLLLRRRKKA